MVIGFDWQGMSVQDFLSRLNFYHEFVLLQKHKPAFGA